MLVRHYERAKAMARERSDEDLAGDIARCDRIGFRFSLLGIASLALLFFGDALIRRSVPAFESGHPAAFRLLTLLMPALGILAFMISGDILRRKRGVAELALRIRSETSSKEDACPRG